MIKSRDVYKFDIGIKKMVYELIDNNTKSDGGFPVCAILLNKKIDWAIVNVNSRFKCLEHDECECAKTDIKNHAEYKCHKDIKKDKNNRKGEYNQEWIITIPPCRFCFQKIFKYSKKNIKIYILFDELRKRMKEPYLKEWVDNKKILELKHDEIKDINIEYNIYYIIMSYLGASLTQRKIKDMTKEKVEDIAKEWVEKLKETIKKNEISKEKIKILEVRLMIEKVICFDVNKIKYKSKNAPFEWITDNKDTVKNKID